MNKLNPYGEGFDFNGAKNSPSWVAADEMAKKEAAGEEPPMTFPLWAKLFWLIVFLGSIAAAGISLC